MDIMQSEEYRSTILKWLLPEAVALPRLLKEFAIQNNQNTTQLGEHGDAILGGLSSLRLNVAHASDAGVSDEEVEKERIVDFYNRLLPSVWPKPAMSSLRSLALYADMSWGNYPRMPLKATHFPSLRTLSFGRYCFSEDAQLDWIISHSSTLQELYLDDCSILFEFAASDTDPQHDSTLPGTIVLQSPDEGRGLRCHYRRRWHDYFASLESGLPHLRHFAIGRGDWYEGMPFEEEHQIRPVLLRDRYMVVDRFVSQDQHPKCDEKDKKALKRLFRKIGQKVDYGAFQGQYFEAVDLLPFKGY
ncbi:uncharacterized protein N7506_004469 [Penicillium brevicompactum]|uniref:uncharacterized protein n=1 Tax=Penicillium brevicompactum TaxID=5074 RepID=UPI0025424BAA|nr:uncharacterized protein N7506_004469 [Penicillium brevicompactum]KAJ5336447.1 hypothetical protein N7506_004469 [Penicillium brevicompactum]